METKKIKNLIIILLILFIFLAGLIVDFFIDKNEIEQTDNNEENNNIDQSQINNTPLNEEQTDYDIHEEIGTYENLREISDLYSYFVLKKCISNYYNPAVLEKVFNNTVSEEEQNTNDMDIQKAQHVLNMIDTEVIESLNLNQNNVNSLYNDFYLPAFCIDRIYKQKLDENKDIYVVYHRLKKNTQSNSSVNDTVLWVKVDEKNETFSIYPYEFLRNYNYLDFGQEDTITVNNLDEIKSNNDNTYGSNINLEDEQLCITEFYNRYKFDVQFDVEGLYGKLNEEFRQLKYSDLEDFIQYINENKENILTSSISKYEVNRNDDSTEYIAICNNDFHYTFIANSILDYTILLDKYTIIPESYAEKYEISFTNTKAKYCIERIIQAINDKNYEFVYQKLNPIQRNNYYSSIEDFRDFIINNFYEKNSFETEEEYLEISSNVYQYNVKVTDATESDFTYRRFTMAVTIKDGTDFEISIIN